VHRGLLHINQLFSLDILARRRRRQKNMREIARQDRQLAGGLTMTLPFMFGWIEHK
jgi:hypothetical protein